ncbi:DUF4430 domain-containing protein [Ruminococcaceae bacterium OttesenSCG-928-L11]|nr:DUF4430 domain-containing protein [Ruminococcaceae bacterium OttesenSCG-928-L11]
MKRSQIIVCAGLIAALVLIGVAYAVSRPAQGGSGAAKTVTVTVIAAEDDVRVHTVATTADTLGQALRDEGLIEGEDSAYGLFITAVDGVAADSAREQWWCLTQAGGDVFSGVDTTPIADGDQFELTLKTGY